VPTKTGRKSVVSPGVNQGLPSSDQYPKGPLRGGYTCRYNVRRLQLSDSAVPVEDADHMGLGSEPQILCLAPLGQLWGGPTLPLLHFRQAVRASVVKRISGDR
jgi:hypothetical protein